MARPRNALNWQTRCAAAQEALTHAHERIRELERQLADVNRAHIEANAEHDRQAAEFVRKMMGGARYPHGS